MENFIEGLLKRLIQLTLILASVGLLSAAAVEMRKMAQTQLTTKIISLSSVQHQLQGPQKKKF